MATAISNEVVVYRARNTVNGNSYVGVTRRGVGRREHEHRYAAAHGGQTRLHKALRKWGDKIQFETIMDFQGDYELAMAFEAELVAKEKPAYNLAPGGLNRVGDIAPETKAKQRASHIGKPNPRKGVKMPADWENPRRGTKLPEEAKDKMRAAAKTRVRKLGAPMAGKKHTEEARAKMSVARKGKPGYWRNKKRPEIKTWLRVAQKGDVPWNRGVPMKAESKAKLSAALKGKAPPPVTPLMADTRAANMRKASLARRARVVCVNDGRVFTGLQAVVDTYGVSKSTVVRLLKSGRASEGGLRFEYEVPKS